MPEPVLADEFIEVLDSFDVPWEFERDDEGDE